jgi:hypothetical protein
MKEVTTVGLDMAKHVFQVHGVEMGPLFCEGSSVGHRLTAFSISSLLVRSA